MKKVKEEEEIERQKAEFKMFVEKETSKMMKVTYKYFDGFQEQKSLTVRKDMVIGDFLELARVSFLKEYPQLMQIKGRLGLFFVIGRFLFIGLAVLGMLLNIRFIWSLGVDILRK